MRRLKRLLYRIWTNLFGEDLDCFERFYGRRRCDCGSRRLVRFTNEDGWECLRCGEWYHPQEDILDGMDPIEGLYL